MCQRFVFVKIYSVHAVVEQFLGSGADPIAHEYAVHLLPDLVRQFSGLADQLKGNGMDDAFLVIHVHGDALPLGFVDGSRRRLLDFHGTGRPFFLAQLAHFTGGGNGDLSVFVFQCTKGAQLQKRGNVRNLFFVNDQFCHGDLPPYISFRSLILPAAFVFSV